ncbi:septum formation family protein [Corynebacterium argentoratense]|uniref:septum formation family protein n=1 Tax=Corynebacterium argentoratense TaxID=42817 RepID=UPI003C6F6F83
MVSSWRSSAPVRVALVASLVGGVAVGGYAFESARAGSSREGGDSSAASSSSQPASDSSAPVASFTTASVGDCVTWDVDAAGAVSQFGQTDCARPHRFEISAREDLGAYPSSEFGPKADMPGVARQAELREELCQGPTIKYLKGHFDPVGRYSVASILPPREQWEAGDRTMLCGVQVTNDDGSVELTSGSALNQDQARIAQAGECVAVDDAEVPRVVDCGAEHSYEVTKVIDLQEVFPDRVPSIEDQDNYLKPVCTQAAMDYVGGDDALYYSTLQPFWTVVPPNSWSGGSHTVNCTLFFPNASGRFAGLVGSAKSGFTIDGQPPQKLPERNPIRQ